MEKHPHTLPPEHKKVLWYFSKAPDFSAKLSVVKFFLKRIFRGMGFRVRIDDELAVKIEPLIIHFVPFWGELVHYKEIFIDKIYEQHSMFKPENCQIIFDCGANIGLYTMRAALSKKTKIFAFEPNPSVFQRLMKNVKANNFSNVTALSLALGSTIGRTSLSWDSSTLSGRITGQNYQSGQHTVGVEVSTLDNIFVKRGIEFIDILKLDVEGNEFEVLKGGKQTLKKIKKIVLEYHSDKMRKVCEPFLKENGFEKVLEIPGHQYYINSQLV